MPLLCNCLRGLATARAFPLRLEPVRDLVRWVIQACTVVA